MKSKTNASLRQIATKYSFSALSLSIIIQFVHCRLKHMHPDFVYAGCGITPVQFSSALDRPTGLRALAEVLLVPAGGDVWLGAAGALEAAKVTASLSDER